MYNLVPKGSETVTAKVKEVVAPRVLSVQPQLQEKTAASVSI
jgi:hypothetical protein